MRTSLRRTAKYDAKVGGMVIPGQTARFKDKMKKQVELEEMVRKIIGADINRVYYIIFAKELNKLKEKYSDDTLNTEADIIHRKWYARGLNNDKLNSIRQAMNLKTYTAPPPAPPVADFSGTPREGYVPLTVNFTDLSTGQVTSWDWNFGDGSAHSYIKNPSHQYTTTGYFDVSLTVTGPGRSDTETKDDYIHVLTAEPWYDPAWNYRKKITIDHTKVAGDLTDFPVLISITDNDIKNHAKSDGSDFVVTASDKTTKLKRELEKYDSSTGTLQLFVKVPSLSSSSDTILYLYYGNPSASETNDKDTWDSNYLMVQHLKETSGTHYDSTINNYNMTATSGVEQGISGKINGCDRFDAAIERIYQPTILDTMPANGTIEIWFSPTNTFNSVSSSGMTLFNKYQDTGGNNSIYVYLVENDGRLRFLMWANGSAYDCYTTENSWTGGTWYYIVITWGSGGMKIYRNGVQDGFSSFTGKPNDGTAYDYEHGYYTRGGSRQFFGKQDEIRVSNIARSSQYIQTCYNNQSNPSTFYSVGAEETKP